MARQLLEANELDWATESARRLNDKATRYASAILRSVLSHTSALVIIAVSTPARAQAATDATANTGTPITVAVWGKASSVLAIVVTAEAGSAEQSSRSW